MTTARLLFQLHWRLFVRAGIPSGPPKLSFSALGRRALILVVLLFVAAQIFVWSRVWLEIYHSVAAPVIVVLLRPLLTLGGSSAVLLIFFYAFRNLISAFTDEDSLRLLLLAPVAPEVVVGERVVAVSLGYSAILLIIVPALYAIAASINMTPVFYPATLLAILLLPVAPVSLGALALMALLRILPPARARTLSLYLSVGMSVLFYLLVRRFSGHNASALTSTDLPPWLPSTWAPQFLAAVAGGQGREAAGYGLLTFGLDAILLGAAIVVGARVLRLGSGSYREARRRRATARILIPPAAVPATASLPTPAPARPWVTIARKDWRILRRDPQQLVLFGYPLFIVGFNAFQLLSRGRSANTEAAVGTTMGLLIFAALLLVATTAAGAVNREGRSLALLALAPVSTGRILLAKWLVATIPPLVIIEAALVGLGLYLRLEIGKAIVLAFFLAALIVTMCGLTLVFNIAWPRLNARSARRQSSGPATILSLLTEAIVGGGAGILLFLAFYLWHGLAAAFAIVGVFLLLGLLVVAAALTSPRLLDQLLHNERLLASAQ